MAFHRSVIAAFLLIIAPGMAGAADQPGNARSIEGITEPLIDVTLSASVAGIIRKEAFQEGDMVKQGDALVELDKKVEELDEAKHRLDMERSKNEKESTEVLFTSTKSVSKEELGKKSTEYKVAEVEHEIAVEQLARRTVIAPAPGRVVEYLLHVGEACQAYQALVRMVDVSSFYFVAHVEPGTAALLRLGEPVEMEMKDTGHPVRLKGTVSFISPVTDPASGLTKIKALFENKDSSIRPGIAATLTFH